MHVWVVERKDPESRWRTYSLFTARTDARSEMKMLRSWSPPIEKGPEYRIRKYTPATEN